MVKKKEHNSVSEIKISEQKKIRNKIISIVNKNANNTNNKSQYLSFYLIKFFEKKHFKAVSKKEVIKSINEIYDKNPKYFKTNNNENFKSKQSLCSTLARLFNKISSCSKKSNLYQFNEKATLKYLNKNLNEDNNDTNNAKTPYKIYNRKSIKKEKNNEDNEDSDDVQIKQEDIKIKDEDYCDKDDKENKEDNNNDKEDKEIKEDKDIKEEKDNKESNNIKEEEKSDNNECDNIENIDNTENMSIEIDDEEILKEEKNNNNFNYKKNIFELFNNKKLYDDFYLYLGEEDQYEQLSEQIENFIEKYNTNKIEEENKFKLFGIIIKIKSVKNMLSQLSLTKKNYMTLTTNFDLKKAWLKFYLEIYHINIRTIKNMRKNVKFNELIIEAKDIYLMDKKKQNSIFDEIIKSIKEIRNVVMNADKIKNDIIKDVNDIGEYFRKTCVKIDKINEFYELEQNLVKGKYSFIVREDITDDMIEKYNKYINLLEEGLDLDNNYVL